MEGLECVECANSNFTPTMLCLFDYIYFLVYLETVQTDGAWNKSSLSDSVQPDLETGDFITCLDYVMEKEALIIGTSKGHLLLYSVDDDATEIVGQVEGGVACISPSPDGDLLAIVTGFGQILVMNLEWDLLYEMPLDDLVEGVDVRKDLFPYFHFKFDLNYLMHGQLFCLSVSVQIFLSIVFESKTI